jgi:hypothetical protein
MTKTWISGATTTALALTIACGLPGVGDDGNGEGEASDGGGGTSMGDPSGAAETSGGAEATSDTASDSAGASAGDDGSSGVADESGGADDGGGDETGEPPQGPGVGPSEDPAADANEPGAYECEGCPLAMIDLDDVDIGSDSLFTISGIAADADAAQVAVVNADGQFMGGMVVINEDNGTFEQTVPVFCGDSLVKVALTNAAGTAVYVKRITAGDCYPSDVRATVAWDNSVGDWQLHLIRFGGQINDRYTSDCCDMAWCNENGDHDWGVEGDASDNPVMDNESYGPAGIEDIVYPGALDGLTIMVENKDNNSPVGPAGTIYINVLGQPTHVRHIHALDYKHVYIAATADGASGDFAWIEEDYDCVADWGSGCEAPIP